MNSATEKPLRRMLINIIKGLGLHHLIRDISLEWEMAQKKRRELREWKGKGCPTPPPDAIKRSHIRTTAKEYQLKILIETGTFYGGTMFAMRKQFCELHSIELFEDLHTYVAQQFAHHPHLHFHQGDSAHLLPKLLQQIDQPCLFWLDGHYMGEGTGLGDKETPVLEEIRAIAASKISNHVILVDDARLFDGTHDYPTRSEFEFFIQEHFPKSSLSLKDDIFFIKP